MEIPVHRLPTLKLGAHCGQLALIVVAWILCITVFRSSADVDGRLGWYFGLCFLTLVPIIYLTMTPRFPRTRRFANAYIMAGVDLLFAVLWLSAFAAVASWNGSGSCNGGCGRSKVVVGLGVVIWILWVGTTAMSVYGLLYYRREGYLPGGSRAPVNAAMIDPDKEAFSTAPGIDEYAPVQGSDAHEAGRHDHHPHDDHDDDDAYHGSQPSRYNSDSFGYAPPRMDENTEYMGYQGVGGASPAEGGRRAQFPGGNYQDA